jgi:hypothetical protein
MLGQSGGRHSLRIDVCSHAVDEFVDVGGGLIERSGDDCRNLVIESDDL